MPGREAVKLAQWFDASWSRVLVVVGVKLGGVRAKECIPSHGRRCSHYAHDIRPPYCRASLGKSLWGQLTTESLNQCPKLGTIGLRRVSGRKFLASGPVCFHGFGSGGGGGGGGGGAGPSVWDFTPSEEFHRLAARIARRRNCKCTARGASTDVVLSGWCRTNSSYL